MQIFPVNAALLHVHANGSRRVLFLSCLNIHACPLTGDVVRKTVFKKYRSSGTYMGRLPETHIIMSIR